MLRRYEVCLLHSFKVRNRDGSCIACLMDARERMDNILREYFAAENGFSNWQEFSAAMPDAETLFKEHQQREYQRWLDGLQAAIANK